MPSPTKLMLVTVSTSKMPGGTQSHGLDESTVMDCAAYRIFPQEAWGG